MQAESEQTLEFSCRATGIGSLPLTSPKEACNLILNVLTDIPFWPQMVNSTFLENMYAQFVYPLPGVKVDEMNKRVYFDTTITSKGLENYIEKLINENVDDFSYDERYFSGFYTLLNMKDRIRDIFMLKGQITGPISLGFQVTDENRKPIYYNDIYRDMIIKNLRMMARWQEQNLKRVSKRTLMFLDEPYLSMIGSAFVSLSRETVIENINEVLSGISDIKAIHCCGNTDWSMVLECDIDVLSFDAYDYSDSLLLYSKQVIEFIQNGGNIAWGIVPTSDEKLSLENASSLMRRLEGIMNTLKGKGIALAKILNRSLITPSCGLGPVSVESAKMALSMLGEISHKMREKYGL